MFRNTRVTLPRLAQAELTAALDRHAAVALILEEVGPDRAFVVHAGRDRYPLGDDVEAIGLTELANLLAAAPV